MKKFEMPKFEMISFTQFENIANDCPTNDMGLEEKSAGEFE